MTSSSSVSFHSSVHGQKYQKNAPDQRTERHFADLDSRWNLESESHSAHEGEWTRRATRDVPKTNDRTFTPATESSVRKVDQTLYKSTEILVRPIRWGGGGGGYPCRRHASGMYVSDPRKHNFHCNS